MFISAAGRVGTGELLGSPILASSLGAWPGKGFVAVAFGGLDAFAEEEKEGLGFSSESDCLVGRLGIPEAAFDCVEDGANVGECLIHNWKRYHGQGLVMRAQLCRHVLMRKATVSHCPEGPANRE